MNGRTAGFVVVACAAVALAASAAPRPQAAAQPAAKAVEKWEYGSLSVASKRRLSWTSASEEVQGEDWAELGAQLKVKFKGGESVTQTRIAVLNHLGGQSWELVSHAIRSTEKTSAGTISRRSATSSIPSREQ